MKFNYKVKNLLKTSLSKIKYFEKFEILKTPSDDSNETVELNGQTNQNYSEFNTNQ